MATDDATKTGIGAPIVATQATRFTFFAREDGRRTTVGELRAALACFDDGEAVILSRAAGRDGETEELVVRSVREAPSIFDPSCGALLTIEHMEYAAAQAAQASSK